MPHLDLQSNILDSWALIISCILFQPYNNTSDKTEVSHCQRGHPCFIVNMENLVWGSCILCFHLFLSPQFKHSLCSCSSSFIVHWFIWYSLCFYCFIVYWYEIFHVFLQSVFNQSGWALYVRLLTTCLQAFGGTFVYQILLGCFQGHFHLHRCSCAAMSSTATSFH